MPQNIHKWVFSRFFQSILLTLCWMCCENNSFHQQPVEEEGQLIIVGGVFDECIDHAEQCRQEVGCPFAVSVFLGIGQTEGFAPGSTVTFWCSASSSEQMVYLSKERTGRKKEKECAAASPFLCDCNSWVCTAHCVLLGEFVSGGASTSDLLPLACHRACSQLCFSWET